MDVPSRPNPLKHSRIYVALAACGIVATGGLAPQGATATGLMYRVTAFESAGPMRRAASDESQPIDAGGVSPRTWMAPTQGGGGGISAQPKFTIIGLNFSTPLGTTSLAQRATIQNLSGYPTGVSISANSLGASFFYSTDCPPSLPDGSSCNFDITYKPFDFVPDSGALNVFCACSGGNVGIFVQGNATRSPQPLLQTAPPALDFPTTPVGSTSATQFLTIRSVSGVAMQLGTLGLGDFAVLPPPVGTCTSSLSPLQTCDMGVNFTPTAVGDRSGLVLLSTDISQSQLAISARGIGRPSGGISPLTVTDRIDFGQVPVGATSSPRPFGIVNNTGGPATVSELSVLGDFEVQKGTCDTIAATETCTANLLFKPTALGPRAGSVTVKSSVDPNAYVTPLAGSGVVNPNPFLSLSATELGYGSGIVGGGEVLNLTITSTGQVPALISRIYALGDFIPTHTCPASLGPGQSCTIEVGFSPRLTGLRTGSLVVDSNAVGSPHSVVLKGNGCTFFSATARGRTLLCSPN